MALMESRWLVPTLAMITPIIRVAARILVVALIKEIPKNGKHGGYRIYIDVNFYSIFLNENREL